MATLPSFDTTSTWQELTGVTEIIGNFKIQNNGGYDVLLFSGDDPSSDPKAAIRIDREDGHSKGISLYGDGSKVWVKSTNPSRLSILKNGGIDVLIQDQFSEDISLFLGQSLATDLSLVADLNVDVDSFQINSPTVAPVVGNFLCIKNGVFFSQVELNSVVDDGGGVYTVGISIPNDHPFTTASSICLQNCDMNIDGSVTPVEFFVSPLNLDAGSEWDITRMITSMTHASAGDDGKFGGITALTNGVYFRLENGTAANLFNAKENSDFANEGFDIAYPVRSGGGGSFGTRSRITFNGADKRGVTKRLTTDNGDKFMAVVRDNLTGLTRMRVKVQGHVVV